MFGYQVLGFGSGGGGPAVATGGNITSDGTYYIHTFLAGGQFAFTGGSVATLPVEFLTVSGGGGGADGGGAGGAGGAGGDQEGTYFESEEAGHPVEITETWHAYKEAGGTKNFRQWVTTDAKAITDVEGDDEAMTQLTDESGNLLDDQGNIIKIGCKNVGMGI